MVLGLNFQNHADKGNWWAVILLFSPLRWLGEQLGWQALPEDFHEVLAMIV